MIEIFFYSVLVMLASLIGVFSVWNRVGQIVERELSLLVSFSAGVFIVIASQLGLETIEQAKTLGAGLIWIAYGALALWLLFKLLPFSHHHHDQRHEGHKHSGLDVRRIMTSDALHNVGDGIVLTASFVVSPSLGVFTAISIFIHELVQGLSEFFVLKQAGYSTKGALTLNFVISSTILIGSLGGFFLLESFEAIKIPLLGLTSGAFLVVVLHDLIPHSIRESKLKGLYVRHLSWFFIGAFLMFVIGKLIP